MKVTFLLEVYGQLEEPDGLSGLVQLRQGGLTTTDQILAAEKAGAWSEALSLYEQSLALEGSSSGGTVGGQQGAGGRAAAVLLDVTLSGTGPAAGSSLGLSILQQGHLRSLLQVCKDRNACTDGIRGKVRCQHHVIRYHSAEPPEELAADVATKHNCIDGRVKE